MDTTAKTKSSKRQCVLDTNVSIQDPMCVFNVDEHDVTPTVCANQPPEMSTVAKFPSFLEVA